MERGVSNFALISLGAAGIILAGILFYIISPADIPGTGGGTTGGSISCRSDAECPSLKYMCEAIQGTGTACPSTDPNCEPTFTITQGICKIREGGACSTSESCASGFYCYQGACTNPVGRQCQGENDTSCGSGYTCIQSCGPPVVRENDSPPPFYCELNELAKKPRVCPICLASNTLIGTPTGEVRVTEIKAGDIVWSQNVRGEKVPSVVKEIGRALVPSTHAVIHVALSDGREVFVSGGHPVAFGGTIADLKLGNVYDGAKIIALTSTPYWDAYTYDILPDSETGFYYANKILMGSTLKTDERGR